MSEVWTVKDMYLLIGIGVVALTIYLFSIFRSLRPKDALKKIVEHVVCAVLLVVFFAVVGLITRATGVSGGVKGFVWLLVFTSLSLLLCVPLLISVARKRKREQDKEKT